MTLPSASVRDMRNAENVKGEGCMLVYSRLLCRCLCLPATDFRRFQLLRGGFGGRGARVERARPVCTSVYTHIAWYSFSCPTKWVARELSMYMSNVLKQ